MLDKLNNLQGLADEEYNRRVEEQVNKAMGLYGQRMTQMMPVVGQAGYGGGGGGPQVKPDNGKKLSPNTKVQKELKIKYELRKWGYNINDLQQYCRKTSDNSVSCEYSFEKLAVDRKLEEINPLLNPNKFKELCRKEAFKHYRLTEFGLYNSAASYIRKESKTKYGQKVDCYRHILASAIITMNYGSEKALALGNLQEFNPLRKHDKEFLAERNKDYWCNAIGRAIGNQAIKENLSINDVNIIVGALVDSKKAEKIIILDAKKDYENGRHFSSYGKSILPTTTSPLVTHGGLLINREIESPSFKIVDYDKKNQTVKQFYIPPSLIDKQSNNTTIPGGIPDISPSYINAIKLIKTLDTND
jgi:hypothetical protein